MKKLINNKAIEKICLILMLVSILCTVTACNGIQHKKAPVGEASVRVAVIDTGFSSKAIQSDRIAGGKNYVDESMGTDDTYGHGTAVASIILENAPNAELVALVSSVYEHGRLTQVDADTFAGIIMDAVDIYGCDVINVSAGFAADMDAIRSAVEYAEERGVVIVAAAGNDYDTNPDVRYYPAAYESVIAVGSMNEDGTQISDFSQRGEWVNVYERGENITVKTLSGGMRTVDGTSFAAAGVTARVIDMLRNDNEMTPEQVRKGIDFKVH